MILSSCWDILERDVVSGVKYETAVHAPCIPCLTTMERICNLLYARAKDLSDMRKPGSMEN